MMLLNFSMIRLVLISPTQFQMTRMNMHASILVNLLIQRHIYSIDFTTSMCVIRVQSSSSFNLLLHFVLSLSMASKYSVMTCTIEYLVVDELKAVQFENQIQITQDMNISVFEMFSHFLRLGCSKKTSV